MKQEKRELHLLACYQRYAVAHLTMRAAHKLETNRSHKYTQGNIEARFGAFVGRGVIIEDAIVSLIEGVLRELVQTMTVEPLENPDGSVLRIGDDR